MTGLAYPSAERGSVVDTYHGTVVADPYRWLEDRDSDAVRGFVAAQNALTESVLSGVADRAPSRDRLAALWDAPRRLAPWRRGRYWFQLRNAGLQDQDVLWVADAPDAEGDVLLDPNALSGQGTISLSGLAVSEDGEHVAWSSSEAGSDWQTWRVRRTATGDDLPDEVRWSKFSPAAWAPDASGFFYGAYDPPGEGAALTAPVRGQRLCFHRLGTDQTSDVVVHHDPDDPEWGYSPQVTPDGRFLVVTVWRGTDPRTRIWVADLGGPAGPADPTHPGVALRPEALRLRSVLDDFDAAWTVAGNVARRLIVLTDKDAPRGRLVGVDVDGGEVDQLVGEQASTLEQVHLVGGRLLAVELHDARHRLRRRGLDGTDEGLVDLPDDGQVEQVHGHPDDPDVHVTFTSFTHPRLVAHHDLATGETRVAWRPSVDVDPGRFVTERVMVDSGGARVPLTLIRPRAAPAGPLPTVLYGYGGFGISVLPRFRADWLVWLEHGGQLAVANLRGGGEYGRAWHDAGRGAHKQRVFDDALACASWLVETGRSATDRLAVTGASNGGLLAAACAVQRPDLFAACVPEVGVLDMLRYHRFTIGWAWASDYGTADDPDQFATLYAYSPLHTLRTGTAYPATLMLTGDHDDRVVPAHSLKFAAALQSAQGSDAPVLLRVQTDTGHGAGTPTGVLINERADVLAFLSMSLADTTRAA